MSVLLLTMGPQLGITADLPVVAVGGAGVIRFRAIGAAGLVKWTLVDSTLPAEWDSALNPDGNAVTLTTPDAETAGTFRVTVRAVDSARIPVVRSFDVRVMALPLTISGAFPEWELGVPATGALSISGGVPPYSGLSITSGALPAGVSLSIVGNQIVPSGTPTVEGEWSATIQVQDSDSASAHISVGGDVKVVVDSVAVSILAKLTSWWEMDEVSGTRADSHGDNHASVYGSLATRDGVRGSGDIAASFPGLGYLEVAHNSTINVPAGGGEHCIFGWVQLDASAGTMGIYSKWNATVSNTMEYAGQRASGIIYAQNGGGAYYNASLSAPPAGTWVFFVGWREISDGKVRLQINNGTVAASGAASDPPQNNSPLTFGRIANSNLSGGMQRWGWIKGNALTTEERTWLYNEGYGRTYDEIVALAGGT